MLFATPMPTSVVPEPSLDELLTHVSRCTGWIMAGGSAQFRHAALTELQSNLHRILQHTRTERVLLSANVLDEKATQVAANKAADAEAVLGLRRVLGEFEQALKACMAAAKKR